MSTAVANALGVELNRIGRNEFRYAGRKLDREQVQQLVDNGMITWQCPGSPDCCNGDGMLYIVVPGGLGSDDSEIEVGIDPATQTLSII